MSIKPFIIALALATTMFAEPTESKPTVTTERLVLVYANLKNAEEMAKGDPATSPEDLKKAGRAMTFGDLKKECLASLDRTTAAVSTAPTRRRPETMAYLKDAMLRLTVDREEPHKGHVDWAQTHGDKISGYIRNYSQTIREALSKL